jgi:hypothetical protein
MFEATRYTPENDGVDWYALADQLFRELTLDPTRDYQPTGAPKGPKRKKFRT